MELGKIIPHVEALIFASDKPLSATDLTELVNTALAFIEDRTTEEQVQSAIESIQEKYASEFYSFEVKQVGGGWQFLTKKEYHKTVAQLNADKYLKKLSVAALETLAIIAYKQPITKSEIENIRGVNCDYAVQKLLEKDLVIIAGRNEEAVGKPLIYTTSKSFMDYFGINSPEDLPKIKEVLMEEMVEATQVSHEETGESQEGESIEEPVILEEIDVEVVMEGEPDEMEAIEAIHPEEETSNEQEQEDNAAPVNGTEAEEPATTVPGTE